MNQFEVIYYSNKTAQQTRTEYQYAESLERAEEDARIGITK